MTPETTFWRDLKFSSVEIAVGLAVISVGYISVENLSLWGATIAGVLLMGDGLRGLGHSVRKWSGD
jgi:hypothetical protein